MSADDRRDRGVLPGTDSGRRRCCSVCLVRAGVELKQFIREREAVVFTFAFPVLLLVIFARSSAARIVDGGVTFAQVFVAGMIAAGTVRQQLPEPGDLHPDRAGQRRAQAAGRHSDAAARRTSSGKIVLVAVIATVQQVLLLAVGVLLLRAGPARPTAAAG